uniref:Uncharacterized protein n=1 Tax=Ananas comosus var. bracteatus TaxID=296719 RepID=A0A6V7QV15_ANACO
MIIISLYSIFAAVVGGVAVLRIVLSFKSLCYLFARWWRWPDEIIQVYQHFDVPRYAENSHEENPLYRKAAVYVSSLPTIEDADAACLFSSAAKSNDFSLRLGRGQTAHDSFLGARVLWGKPDDDRLVLRVRRRDRRGCCGRTCSRWRRRGWRRTSRASSAAARTTTASAARGAGATSSTGPRARASRPSPPPWRAPSASTSTTSTSPGRGGGDRDLKSLLLRTAPRALILVEDLDRFLAQRGAAERFSETLNFMDGVVACCGDERVMVFTAASADAIDPAALRPGRIDVQVHFPMCDFAGFKAMANSYLGITEHKLYPQVQENFHSGGEISPAEVGEIMIANRGSPSRAIKSVIGALQQAGAAARRRRTGDSWTAAAVEKRTDGAATTAAGSGGVGAPAIKEFKKLYGMIKMRSTNRREAVVPVDDDTTTTTTTAAAPSSSSNLEKEG